MPDVKWEGGKDDRTILIKILVHIIKILKEYNGETVIFRDDYVMDAIGDYPELYKL
jgi:hypothetical protein